MDARDSNHDTMMRMAAFEHVRRLAEAHDLLTATELKPGFMYDGQRVPLINPQRGIFKPQQMRFLLSIKTVFPKPGDGQRHHLWIASEILVQVNTRSSYHGYRRVD
jgi:hypothetical protein